MINKRIEGDHEIIETDGATIKKRISQKYAEPILDIPKVEQPTRQELKDLLLEILAEVKK